MNWETHRYPVVRHRPVNTTVAHPVTSLHQVTLGQVAAHLGSNSLDMMGMLYKHECILTYYLLLLILKGKYYEKLSSVFAYRVSGVPSNPQTLK